MRPVDRGANTTVYTNYQNAGPELQTRLGAYCSYCERQIETNLAVEHIQPKNLKKALKNQWTNFLLGCVNCNSSKGAKHVSLPKFLWPDLDNTLRAFEYGPAGLVRASSKLNPKMKKKAKALIQLTGLDKDPGNPGLCRRPTESDKRWLRRMEASQKARRYRDILASQHTPETRELIVDIAKGKGMFSIYWMQFAHDIEMKKRFREAFVGTASSCFDTNEDLQPRPGGQV